MSAAPYLASPLAIQIHLAAAITAFLLGSWLLLRAKGTATHRRLGRIWMALMALISITSFFVPGTVPPVLGPFGLIHLLSVWVLIAISVAIWAARTGRVRHHRIWVTAVYAGALIGAGAGAFAPGRLLSEMLGYG